MSPMNLTTQRANWKETPDRKSRAWAYGYVSINSIGMIRMSGVIWQRLGEPRAALVLFDPDNSRLGIQPTIPQRKNSVTVFSRGPKPSRFVSAGCTLQEFGIVIPETLQFQDPFIDQDGILVLDLRTARVNRRVTNHARNRDRKEAKTRGKFDGPLLAV